MDLAAAKESLPENMFCEPEHFPGHRPPRLVSAMAFSPSLETSFSGITYHLAKGGMAARKLEGCFSLYSGRKPLKSLQVRGALWKLSKLLQWQKSGGFKFTNAYVDVVWPRYIEALAGATLINNFQLYSPEFIRRRRALGIGAYYYIDGTLAEYFGDYADFEVASIDPSTRQHALELEQQGYDDADGLIVMSRLAARTLQDRYKVPSSKISVVVPGANLLDDAVDAVEIQRPPSDDFVLGFVGLYPERKGLDRLAQAIQILRSRRLPIRLRVIGACPEHIQSMDGIDFLGRIDKKTDFKRFVQAIGSVQLGCLVSRSELAGIALLEFLRLGVPVLGTRVGGIPDILEGGGSLLVEHNVAPEALANIIAETYSNEAGYRKLKQEAGARRQWASWKRVAEELDSVLP
jgi:glycosyltransferase involved in cell wall biosynthesis